MTEKLKAPMMGQMSDRDVAEAEKTLAALSSDELEQLCGAYTGQRGWPMTRPFTKHGERLQSLGLAVPVGDVGWLKRRTAYLLSIWGALVAAHALSRQVAERLSRG